MRIEDRIESDHLPVSYTIKGRKTEKRIGKHSREEATDEQQ